MLCYEITDKMQSGNNDRFTVHAFKRNSACNKIIYFIMCGVRFKESQTRTKKSVVAIMTKIFGNGTKGQERFTFVDCGSGATVRVFPYPPTRPHVYAYPRTFSFFSRFLETVSCTRFWVIYFYGFERRDGVEKEREKKTRAHTHQTHAV